MVTNVLEESATSNMYCGGREEEVDAAGYLYLFIGLYLQIGVAHKENSFTMSVCLSVCFFLGETLFTFIKQSGNSMYHLI
jgi:hypothetical protein